MIRQQLLLIAKGIEQHHRFVAFTKNKERLVGDAARRQASVNSDRTIFSIKRHMGTDYKKKIDGKAIHHRRYQHIFL